MHNNINYERKLRLLSRNESKIKSFDSCFDIRAWSHDCAVRNEYLREWMKCDMPHCVLPVNVLSNYLCDMARGRRCRPIPRCHPECKSKYILDSICNSCDAMRECLKSKKSCTKLFQEEEFETSAWPCERCLDALKSIKMFWKIIMDKVFHLKYILKCSDENTMTCQSSSVRSLTEAWQSEMFKQTTHVKLVSTRCDLEGIPRKYALSRVASQTCVKCCSNYSSKAEKPLTISDDESYGRYYKFVKPMFRSQQTQTQVETTDAACNACITDKQEIASLKCDLFFLKQNFNAQKRNLAEVTHENELLKATLHNKSLNSIAGSAEKHLCSSVNSSKSTSIKTGVDQIYINPIQTDSEMIITMKTCKCKCYQRVSLLQVIHKTNNNVDDNVDDNVDKGEPCYKKEDPLKLLKRVQSTFEAIVEREINLTLDKNKLPKNVTTSAETFRICKCKSRCKCKCKSIKFVDTSDATYTSATEQSVGNSEAI